MPTFKTDLVQLGLLLGLGLRQWYNILTSRLPSDDAGRKALPQRKPGGPCPAETPSRATTRRATPSRHTRTGMVLVFGSVIAIVTTIACYQLFQNIPLCRATVYELAELENTATAGERARLRDRVVNLFKEEPECFLFPTRDLALTPESLAEEWIAQGLPGLGYAAEGGRLNLRLASAAVQDSATRLTAMMFLGLLFWNLGGVFTPVKHLNQIDAQTIWLLSLPVSRPVLYMSQVLTKAMRYSFFWCAAFPMLQPVFESLDKSSALQNMPPTMLIVLTVVAAPLAEEFIFRGLLFAGLRVVLPLPWAIALSAAMFALIHPAASILPVFGLGCIAALVYHRTGWLLAPVLTHAVYNGAIAVQVILGL